MRRNLNDGRKRNYVDNCDRSARGPRRRDHDLVPYSVFSGQKEVLERHFQASVGESGIGRKRDFYERGFFPPSRSHSQIRGALRLYRNAENVLPENEIS